MLPLRSSRPPLMSWPDRKSTRLNSSHRCISYAVFCLKKNNVEFIDAVRELGDEFELYHYGSYYAHFIDLHLKHQHGDFYMFAWVKNPVFIVISVIHSR